MQAGEQFPDFTLPRDGGSTMSLADFKGRNLVIFLYPKDDTPGCTKESIEFTANIEAFDAVGADIIGLSKDSPDSHVKFIEKFELGMPLMSDESGELVETLGVWVEKNMYGRTYMGIMRTTFLIDGTGEIKRVWNNVKVDGHVADVLEAVKAL